MKRILVIILLAGAGGCAVGPDYHAPAVKTPAHWSSPQAGGETNTPAEEAAWWKNFHDLELDSLITRAVSSNLTRRAVAAQVRQARAARGIVAAQLGPTLDATASYARERYSKHGFPPFPPGVPLDANVYQAAFDASWEIDIFGGTRRAVESANATLAAAEFSEREVLVSLLAEVAREYIETRGAQQQLAVALKNIHAQEEILAIARDRFEHGLGSDLDVKRAATILATTRAQVPMFESLIQTHIYALSVLVARPPGALQDELSAQAPIPAAPPAVPVGLPSDLLLRRPDVRQAERALASATAQIGVARADLFPKFSLTGIGGIESIGLSDWFTWGSRFWTLGPTMQWRIFDAGKIRGNIRLRTAIQEQVLANYEQTALTAFEETEDALTAYAKEQVRRESLRDAVNTSTDVVQQFHQLYAHGLTSFLEVLDAERTMYQAEDQLVQSDRTVSLNLVRLYKALGGPWEVGASR